MATFHDLLYVALFTIALPLYDYLVGWRLWVSIVLVALVVAYLIQAIVAVTRDSAARASVREQSRQLAAVLPRTRAELNWFVGLAVTAGFCEEVLFRGYFIWTFAPWIGWWGAAAGGAEPGR